MESADADLSAELNSLAQGSPGSKPELLFVVVRMRALAYLRTTTSLCCSGLTLTCRAGWQCTPPSRSRCSSGRDGGLVAFVDTAFVAYVTASGAVDTAFGAWHGGHSLWSLARWTQPLDLRCGAEDAALWSNAQVVGSGPWLTEGDNRVLWGLRSGTLFGGTCQVPYIYATFADFDSFLLQAIYL